ncbi:MAG: hypothetical protein ACM3ST_08405 [Bdellovibrio bacteriovorus]
MTIETVPGSDTRYYLINFDKDGRERLDDPDAPNGRLSDTVAETLIAEPITDCVFMSHGWQGDVPAAKRQYDAWSGAMLGCSADIERLRTTRPGFKPLLIGIHWPSLPWGDEDPTARAASFAPGEPDPVEAWIDDAASKLVDSESARQALRTIFTAALEDLTPDELPPEVIEAYRVLQAESGLGSEGPGGAPGDDIERFDPEGIYAEALESEGAFGGVPGLGALLAPLRQLSFWQMKARARSIGESGAATLLRRLQSAAGDRDLRFHLMGHSFGCIVVSAAVNGAGGDAPLPRPVHSLFLAQGALSLWAYCSEIPSVPGKRGYFHPLMAKGKVAGPIVTTQSQHDTAVRVYYPMGAGVAGQVDFAPGELPKYGGVGVFGIQGPGIPLEGLAMLSPESDYGFHGGRVYNLESSGFINQGSGASGAHSDIAKPAVALDFWQAIATPAD